jgi:hypothetical protein
MKKSIYFICLIFVIALLIVCSGKETEEAVVEEKKAEITQEELTAAVPALNDLHEAVYPLWHTAYPEKDFALIKELIPRLNELATKVDEAELPGILRDKQEAWDEGKAFMKSVLQKLQEAGDVDDEEGMLKQAEDFHTAFEKLVRLIRPLIPELDAFHQEMYKLYHYYMPEYDLENIRLTVSAMQEKMTALLEAELPKRLEERKEKFAEALQELNTLVNKLAETVKQDDKEAIDAAVEKVHTAYQAAEHIFD